MRISARNQMPATVRSVSAGQVMAEVVVEVDGGHEVVAAITAESARRLGLVPGRRVLVVAHRGANKFAPPNTLPRSRTGTRLPGRWRRCITGLSRIRPPWCGKLLPRRVSR